MALPFNKDVKKAMEEGTDISKTTCTIHMDGEVTTTDDFIAVMVDGTGQAKIMFNTDALTMGMGMQMISRAFVEAMAALTEPERLEIQAILTGDFEMTEEAPDAKN